MNLFNQIGGFISNLLDNYILRLMKIGLKWIKRASNRNARFSHSRKFASDFHVQLFFLFKFIYWSKTTKIKFASLRRVQKIKKIYFFLLYFSFSSNLPFVNSCLNIVFIPITNKINWPSVYTAMAIMKLHSNLQLHSC